MDDRVFNYAETPEEMVERLCRKWVNDLTFAHQSLFPLFDPEHKQQMVDSLKEFDKSLDTFSEVAEDLELKLELKNHTHFKESRIITKLLRERQVLQELTSIYAFAADDNFPEVPNETISEIL